MSNNASQPKSPNPLGRGGTGPSALLLGWSSITADTLPPSRLASGPVALPPKAEVIFARTLSRPRRLENDERFSPIPAFLTSEGRWVDYGVVLGSGAQLKVSVSVARPSAGLRWQSRPEARLFKLAQLFRHISFLSAELSACSLFRVPATVLLDRDAPVF